MRSTASASPAPHGLPPLHGRMVRPGPRGPFCSGPAGEAGGPVLELACGLGRLAVPLARDGHDVG